MLFQALANEGITVFGSLPANKALGEALLRKVAPSLELGKNLVEDLRRVRVAGELAAQLEAGVLPPREKAKRAGQELAMGGASVLIRAALDRGGDVVVLHR